MQGLGFNPQHHKKKKYYKAFPEREVSIVSNVSDRKNTQKTWG
jgi:hypothetical protein